MNYLPLPDEFDKKGFHHKLIKTSEFKKFGDGVALGSWRIYERKAPNHTKSHYEVVLIRQHDSHEINGFKTEPKEGYPSSELWGSQGFTLDTLKEAENKFDSLTLTTRERLKKIKGL